MTAATGAVNSKKSQFSKRAVFWGRGPSPICRCPAKSSFIFANNRKGQRPHHDFSVPCKILPKIEASLRLGRGFSVIIESRDELSHFEKSFFLHLIAPFEDRMSGPGSFRQTNPWIRPRSQGLARILNGGPQFGANNDLLPNVVGSKKDNITDLGIGQSDFA
jgi:hypothetical protein